MKTDIVVLFLILEGKLSTFIIEYDANCGVFIYSLYHIQKTVLYSCAIEGFFNHEMVLNFVKCFFWFTWVDRVSFFSFILLLRCITFINFYMLNYPYIPLDPHIKMLLIQCWHFVEDFCIDLHKGCWDIGL